MNFFIFCNFSVEWRWHVMKNKECILTTWFEHIWTSHVCISLWPFDTLPRTRAASPLTANTTPRWSVLSSDDQFFILFFLNISTCWRNNAMRWRHRLRAVNERLTMSPFTFNVTDDVIIMFCFLSCFYRGCFLSLFLTRQRRDPVISEVKKTKTNRKRDNFLCFMKSR